MIERYGSTKELHRLNRSTLLEASAPEDRSSDAETESGGQRIKRSKKSGPESKSGVSLPVGSRTELEVK